MVVSEFTPLATLALGLPSNMKFSHYSNQNIIPEVIDQHHNMFHYDVPTSILTWPLSVELCRVKWQKFYQYNCICVFYFCSTTVANAIYTKLNVCMCINVCMQWNMLWKTEMALVVCLD